MTDTKPVPLADFLAALRSELKAAHAERDPDLQLEVGPVTVEFTVLTRQEGEGKAGIKFWVVDAGVSGKLIGESTQKVTMQLMPLDSTGDALRVNDTEQRGQGHGDVEPRALQK
jgi:Trypsin-co-occurring domain 2